MAFDDKDQTDTKVDARFAGLGPPRFSLRMLLLLPLLLGIFILLFQWFGAIAGTMFLLATIVIAMHVIGNAIGTKLRDNSDRITRQTFMKPRRVDRATAPLAAQQHFAPATSLSHKGSLGMPQWLATLFGVLVGGVSGFWILNRMYPNELPLPVMSVGVLSASLLSGFCSFWIWSLCHVVATSWWQAHSSEKRDAQKSNGRRSR